MNLVLRKVFILLIISMLSVSASIAAPFVVDTPAKAIALYFPTPAVMRCLNHSEIPEKFRKAQINRRIRFPKQGETLENILVGAAKGKFVIHGSVIDKDEIIPLDFKTNSYFNINKSKKFDFSFLFGLGNILGLQPKVQVKDKFGNQDLNYETFLKITKGMVGNSDYYLELSGQDRTVQGQSKYFLNGYGMIGNKNIIVKAGGLKKDNYQIYEKIGPVEIFTTVNVYD